MTDLTTQSDDELLRRAYARDEEAFLLLYRRRSGGVFRFALHMSGNQTVAEEVTQEVFLAVIRDGGRFDSTRGTVTGYLLGVARNHVLRLLERNGQFVGLPDVEGAVESAEDSAPGPLLQLTQTELVSAVRDAVLSLATPYREAVVMCDLQEMSYADAALALHVPVGTVRSRLSRGRALLQDKFRRAGIYGSNDVTQRAGKQHA